MKPKVITCRVMENELRAFMPEDTDFEVLEISQHNWPNVLRASLQKAIDAADGQFDPILLGYGLCSQSVVGLCARRSRLVVFRSDDCIGLFMGSRQARREFAYSQPGSYFLTHGWIGDGSGSVFDEYARLEKRYGPERARTVFKKLLQHYRQLVYITLPGSETLDQDRGFTQEKAVRFGLEFVEVEGATELIRRMAEGVPDAEILVVPPGEPITLEMMMG